MGDEDIFDVGRPLRALVVALTGAGLAWLWFNDLWWVALVVAIVAVLAGLLAKVLGTALLPRHPKRAVAVLEWWIVTPGVLAAVGAAVVVVLAVEMTVAEGTATSTKEVVAALSAGLTAFVTATFISWAGEGSDSTLGNEIRKVFYSKYKRAPGPGQPRSDEVHYFMPESTGERWVYSMEFGGVEGWGHDARRKRAAGIATELKSKASDG